MDTWQGIMGSYSFVIKRNLEMEGWLWLIRKKVMAQEEGVISHFLISTSNYNAYFPHLYKQGQGILKGHAIA